MTEAENKDRLRPLLAAHFELMEEVWMREPISGNDCRIDFLAVTGDVLPWDVFGVEVKRSDLSGGRRRHAFKQCVDYRRCVVNDQRVPGLRGRYLPVVALYYGAPDPRRWRGLNRQPTEEEIRLGVEVRCFGCWNVGVLVHGSRGLTLEISEEPIWAQHWGATDVGITWPVERRFANGTKRAV